MQARLILGPAGSGKTFCCLAEIRAELMRSPEGPPLIFLTPKQTTYQLEHQLLADAGLRGYTRLQILSFERLAFYIRQTLRLPAPRLLDEAGRLMVLRSLLAKKREGDERLRLFHASARLNGFAQHLSRVLRELQRQGATPESLADLAEHLKEATGLGLKLRDLAVLLREYLDWLAAEQLQDEDWLLHHAAESLKAAPEGINFGQVWLDGFLEFSPVELELLAQLLPYTTAAAIHFCLDREPKARVDSFSQWNPAQKTFFKCRERLNQIPGCSVKVETLRREPGKNRFSANRTLEHLAKSWEKTNEAMGQANGFPQEETKDSVRLVTCLDPEAEAVLAARTIRSFVRQGGRYSDIAVLTRDLEIYHDCVANTFRRYDIPFFMDRRESMAHHPLAELTRNALRTIALGWTHRDWFSALKTGLVFAEEGKIDRLENEALARGWKGQAWSRPLVIDDSDPAWAREIEPLRKQLTAPFEGLALNFGQHPNGRELAAALRIFWQKLNILEQLEHWSGNNDRAEPIHLTVWEQMEQWLKNVELAFAHTELTLREWLPILEAGLSGLSVGVIPPVLDQVLIGAIDRSRNPEIKLVIMLGMNEMVFPAPPVMPLLLTENDRRELAAQGLSLAGRHDQMNREQFFGYIAMTRAREQLVLTNSQSDATGKALNPSPFLNRLQTIFPELENEIIAAGLDWRQSEHPHELVAPYLKNQLIPAEARDATLAQLETLPAIAGLQNVLAQFGAVPREEKLDPLLAAQLYGASLRTSVSRMEQFAACPFKFFVHSGLRAAERQAYELDVREQGNFQHQVLEEFHNQLQLQNKRWRDVSPKEAREQIKAIAAALTLAYREGLLQASDEGKFAARVMTESLQDFIEVLVGWMQTQYPFDPVAVEIPFGAPDESAPPWKIPLANGKALELAGRIDRIDVLRLPGEDSALCVVVDYKSSHKKLSAIKMRHGLQLQLPAYLNVLRHWPNVKKDFGIGKLIPAGVFYVSLRGEYEAGENRDVALADREATRKIAYRHAGRFDDGQVKLLDQRKGQTKGDQFNYTLKKDGTLARSSRDALPGREFAALLEQVELTLQKMGDEIYAGVVKVDPFRLGKVIPCEHCDYRPICRLDPWTHHFRVLQKNAVKEVDAPLT